MKKHVYTRSRPRVSRARRAPVGSGRRLTAGQLRWISALFAVAGLGVLALAIVPGDFTPRRHVDGTYARSPSDDIGGAAVAYTSPLSPTRLAGDITGEWPPARGSVDAEGVYQRYADDTVVILRRGKGSLILVENAATAYPRYVTHVAGQWDR